MKLLAFDPKKRKQVLCGEIIGDILFRDVDPIKHLMRVSNSYAIQHYVLPILEEKGIKKIVIKEKGGMNWEADLKTWKENSKTADYGHGKQTFLGLKFMKKYTPKEKKYDFVDGVAIERT